MELYLGKILLCDGIAEYLAGSIVASQELIDQTVAMHPIEIFIVEEGQRLHQTGRSEKSKLSKKTHTN